MGKGHHFGRGKIVRGVERAHKLIPPNCPAFVLKAQLPINYAYRALYAPWL